MADQEWVPVLIFGWGEEWPDVAVPVLDYTIKGQKLRIERFEIQASANG
jgi:hypothetical protein